MKILKLRLPDLLTFVGVWSFLLMPNVMPYPFLSGFLVVILIRIFSVHFYRDLEFALPWDLDTLKLLASFFGILLVAHNFNLFLPLGSDEPHHTERSLFLLKGAFEWIQTYLDLRPFESFRGNYNNLLDPRVMSAGFLWPLLFWSFTGLLGLILWAWRKAYQRKSDLMARSGIDLLAILALAGLGRIFVGWPDNHPPMRTFFGFVSAGIFGLNSFSFRISGLLAVSLFLVWLYRRLETTLRPVEKFLICLLAVMSPVVFFNSILMEPAIYAYIGWAMILGLLLEAYDKEDLATFKKAVLLIPVFVLFRHTCLLLLFPAGLVYLLKFWKQEKFPWTYSVVIALVSAPYFWALYQFGNSAGAAQFSVDQVLRIFTEGQGLMSIVNSMGLLWTLALVGVLLVGFMNLRRLHWFLFSWVFLFVVYHLLMIEGVWGIARYQVEFICAPMLILTLWFLKNYPRFSRGVAVLSVFLAFSSIDHIQSIPKDIFADDFQAMRATNTSFLPQDQAINYLHRQDAGFGFLMIGSLVPTFESVLWFEGYDLVSARRWLGQIYEYQQLQAQNPNWDVMSQYLKTRNIKYLMLINGLPRERVGQTAEVKRLVQDIRSGNTGPVKLKFDRSFETKFGGILEIFAVL